jgi:hypothetical protein
VLCFALAESRLNKSFLKDLENRLNEWVDKDVNQQLFGDLFVRFGPYFKMYSMYCNNYEAASKLLEVPNATAHCTLHSLSR